jgi:hypothetical protein
MRLKRTLVSAIAALGLSASLMAPVALAQPTQSQADGSDTTTATVNVSAPGGSFDVYFESTTLSLTDVTLSALTPNGTSTGTFRLRYTDTLPDRPEFDVTVGADDFTSGSNTIPASGFKITRTANVTQFQWGNPGGVNNAYCYSGQNPNPLYDPALCTAYPPPVDSNIGDIGYFQDGTYQGQNSENWTANAPGLDTATKVHYGRHGVGTQWSYGDVDVELEVPDGTPGGTYSSLLTLSVVTGTQP